MLKHALIEKISSRLAVSPGKISNVLDLLEEGATIPFIARYRKERTGSLDEVQLQEIRDLCKQLQDLEHRRAHILETIKEQGKLTAALQLKIEQAETLQRLEDLYLPFKPKRRTKATIAREQGLEPLAKIVSGQRSSNLFKEAQRYVDPKRGLNDVEEALEGARYIIAEWISENSIVRERLRKTFLQNGKITSKVVKAKAAEAVKFKDYFDWQEPVKKIPSHRFLAMMRGQSEGFLRISIAPEKEQPLAFLERFYVKADNDSGDQVMLALKDSYKRLLKPTLETETRNSLKLKADTEAIGVFAENLRELLLAAPLGQVATMAIDPGFRTGCKLACLDPQGNLKEYITIFPFRGQAEKARAAEILVNLCHKHRIKAVAIGNGTAGRESMQFLKELELDKEIQLVMVNESGASIYSASAVARQEFPKLDLTYRGAVSIGRRLMDPLAELVKIDAKSIGVGQYQHDVAQDKLKERLDETVMSCVNAVGVEVNTASKELLAYVSGLGPKLAENIVQYRKENGPYKSRAGLKKVPRLGPKAFEQCAGFLRIAGAKNPLDRSAVHPEAYPLVKKMAADLNRELSDLMSDSKLRGGIKISRYVSPEFGIPTLEDILKELAKPGRDPRGKFEQVSFKEGVNEIQDLYVGMIMPGIITNVTNFGAFVDIGVHQDGLVHISQLANRFIKDPTEFVKVGQKVKVKVIDLEIERKRINLSMKQAEAES